MPRYVSKSCVIAAGEALSNTIDCSVGRPCMLYMPDAWTPAHLSFLVSVDGQVFNDLFTSDGLEIILNVVANTAVALPPEWVPLLFLRVRSGTRDTPMVQESDRTLTITIDTRAAALTMPRADRLVAVP